jgi:hypothetical protein
MSRQWDIDLELVKDWLAQLADEDYEQVIAALTLLEDRGPQLGRPIVDSVEYSAFANMKELRPGSSKRSEIRVLFAFDPKRRAILLVAGDKAGEWKSWYRTNIPKADALYQAHIDRLKET